VSAPQLAAAFCSSPSTLRAARAGARAMARNRQRGSISKRLDKTFHRVARIAMMTLRARFVSPSRAVNSARCCWYSARKAACRIACQPRLVNSSVQCDRAQLAKRDWGGAGAMRLAKGGPLGLRAAFTRLRVIPTCTFCACQSSVESAYLELQVDSLGFHRVRLREFDLVLHIFLLQWREFSIVDVNIDGFVVLSSL
jgi:hypothetical protein